MPGRRPFDTVLKPVIGQFFSAGADSLKASIKVTQIEKGGKYDVKASISGGTLDAAVEGQYDSATGCHAEISALEKCQPASNVTLRVSPPPCKRCAFVLGHLNAKTHSV